jgi:nucleotide-binding universal stress UspA family protein
MRVLGALVRQRDLRGGPSASTRCPIMSLRSILVHAEPGEASRARIELAARLAQRFKATLIGVAAGEPEPTVADPYGRIAVADIMNVEEERVRGDLKEAEEIFRTCPAAQGLDTQWRSATGFPAEVVTRESRAADLIVLGRHATELGRFRSVDPGDVLMRAGRPVLTAPPGTTALDARHVLVAWKDTREARRALHDALPLMRAAESVLVVEIADEAQADAAAARTADVAHFLALHGVTAKAEHRLQGKGSVADALCLAAEQNHADLIVSGGYGHARLREWVFGGVTADLLNHSPQCCLFSH